MNGVLGLIILLLACIGLVLIVVALGLAMAPVSRAMLETFMDRTGVVLTSDSAPLVVDGLARSRRWRTAGVLLSLAVWLAWSIVSGTVVLDTTMGALVALGYALGAVAGEVRSTFARPAGPRSATLAPRRESDYVRPWARSLPGVLVVVAAVLALPVALHHLSSAAVLLGEAIVVWVVGRWCSRLIVERPIPAAGRDVVDADAGLRSRALHAIGAAVTLVGGWVVIALAAVAMLGSSEPQPNSALAWLALLLMIAWLIYSVALGTSAFPVVTADHPDLAADAPQGAEVDPRP